MCMIACEDCGTPIDTEAEPECWFEIGNVRGLNREIVLCDTCRWLRVEASAEAIETATEVYGRVG